MPIANGGNRNHRLYREVNNRIREISDSFGVDGSTHFLCECGRVSCLAPITLSLTQFDGLLGDPDRVLLAAIHRPSLDGERIVAEYEDFLIVTVPARAAAA